MTNQQSYARRRLLAEDLRSGLRPLEVARKHGVHKSLVYRAGYEAGLTFPKLTITRKFWKGVDWSKSDLDLAIELNFTESHVRRQRKTYGRPYPITRDSIGKRVHRRRSARPSDHPANAAPAGSPRVHQPT